MQINAVSTQSVSPKTSFGQRMPSSEELENFKKVFQEYLPFYVLNFDSIENYIVDDTISKQLVKDAKYIYETNITPTRKTGINNYSMEVVFIPTFNESMTLKRKMEEW